MKNDTRKYLEKEVEMCDQIWKEHEFNENNDLDHFHICDFELLNMIWRHKKSYRKYEKECKKMCVEYLHSIGHERDEEHMECCDYCPHMRYLTLSKDNYFLNIASLGIEDNYKYIFDEEKRNDN